jgi:hypothetical protein
MNEPMKKLQLIYLLIFFITINANAAIRFVTPAGGLVVVDGTSWANAFPGTSLQAAINARGTKLTAAEARKHHNWFLETVNSFYIECQSHNGNVCCIDCHIHGILGVWCFANCFVARFPDIN